MSSKIDFFFSLVSILTQGNCRKQGRSWKPFNIIGNNICKIQIVHHSKCVGKHSVMRTNVAAPEKLKNLKTIQFN